MRAGRPRRSGAAAVALSLLGVCLLPGSSAAARPGRHLAAAVLPGEPTPMGVPFLPSSTPLHITIAAMVANQMTVQNNVTIRLADGSTVTTTRYTFVKLQISSNMAVTQSVNGYTLHINVPSNGSLGGLDTAGNAETTVMWGNISNICVTVIFQICGVQGLLNALGSIIPLTAGAQNFVGDIYAIQTTDDHAALSSTNNPVHLPGSLAVSTP
ncbi:hypothetical protein [Streptacidiphilus jiangxiensis]|uniref:DUF4382 domain-containing protein n=1 Tax=Streptacidiphilus jiangxiensis TaxID=235985 RepID=A0A1H7UVJ4_STRJI|nr:hypothetical protein [Streptacidiphilus jiangxiensis]SEM00993.1 hypothetical protein SAMN05414137_116200 [Streptacidiphilus jiangxiensis]